MKKVLITLIAIALISCEKDQLWGSSCLASYYKPYSGECFTVTASTIDWSCDYNFQYYVLEVYNEAKGYKYVSVDQRTYRDFQYGEICFN